MNFPSMLTNKAGLMQELLAINPSKIWLALSSCTNWLGNEDFFIGAVFVHSDNVTCQSNSLYFDEVNNILIMISSVRDMDQILHAYVNTDL
ncbi:UNVERIFIED_CONTAM: hypothetical protein NCL1_37948 [Trichonephila clavipes]